MRGGRTIGLDRTYEDASDRARALGDVLQEVNQDDLVEYGLIPKLVGRIGTIVPLRPLTREDLLRILLETPDSPVTAGRDWATPEGFTLEFSWPLLAAIAEEPAASGLGSRVLFGLVSRCTRRALFEVPTDRRHRYRHPVVSLDVEALRDGAYRVEVPRRGPGSPLEQAETACTKQPLSAESG